jgi:hypothetical protein
MKPPTDWFLGDETKEMKGLTVPNGPATGSPPAETKENLRRSKLPPSVKISVYTAGINSARQMALG